MIRITKPTTAPAVLTTSGATATLADCSLFDSAQADYIAGTKKLTIDSGIYGHRTVKAALLRAQHGKCAFCESKISPISYGDIEHYRPKAGYKQKKKDKLGRPGYYWMAYRWENLFLVCQICNQRHKRNFFPLVDPAKRAIHHGNRIEDEEPLLVHPELDDPEQHVAYHDEIAVAKNGDARGAKTIEVAGLNREPLAERRREFLRILKTLKDVASLGGPQADSAREHLRNGQKETAEFASMIRCLCAKP